MAYVCGLVPDGGDEELSLDFDPLDAADFRLSGLRFEVEGSLVIGRSSLRSRSSMSLILTD